MQQDLVRAFWVRAFRSKLWGSTPTWHEQLAEGAQKGGYLNLSVPRFGTVLVWEEGRFSLTSKKVVARLTPIG